MVMIEIKNNYLLLIKLLSLQTDIGYVYKLNKTRLYICKHDSIKYPCVFTEYMSIILRSCSIKWGFFVLEYLLEVVAEQPKTKINGRAIFW